MKADKLFLGRIITLDPRNPVFEACTVKDGVFQYAGSREIAEKLCDEHTQVFDYGDNCIYPGFIEGHCHGWVAGPRLAFYADLTPGKTMSEYVEIMKEFAQKNPGSKHFWGAGWQLRDTEPTADMLDEVSTDVPVVLQSVDIHSLWLNHKAMEYYGVDKACMEKWGTELVRPDKNGNPSGYISENPTMPIMQGMLKLDIEDQKKALLCWQDFALSKGITAYYEAGVYEESAKAYCELIKEGKWKIRVYAGWMIDENVPDYIEAVHKAKAAADKYNCEYFQIIGLKLFMDGVIEAHTGWTIDDYADKPGYKGIQRFHDLDRTVELYKEACKFGFNVHQHTVGDGAVKFAVDCIEKAQLETGNMDMRNAVAHLQLVRPEDVKRICDLNIIALVAPLWMHREVGYYEQSEAYLGKRRAFYQYPLQSFIANNGVLAFHTDYPVSPQMSIPQTIYCAQERNNPDEDVFTQLNYHEVISREDALAGLTTGPAYEVKQENRLGTIMIGMVANMSVFDKNFLTDDINEVAHSKLVATIIDGEEVYRA